MRYKTFLKPQPTAVYPQTPAILDEASMTLDFTLNDQPTKLKVKKLIWIPKASSSSQYQS
jgi:hypothetical protein